MSPNDDKVITMSRKEMKLMISETVSQTLTSMGIDHEEPFEMQKDFIHLREQRLSSESIKEKSQSVLIGMFITGLLSMVILGLKDYFKN